VFQAIFLGFLFAFLRQHEDRLATAHLTRAHDDAFGLKLFEDRLNVRAAKAGACWMSFVHSAAPVTEKVYLGEPARLVGYANGSF
jgi:hypothetical protein